MSTQPTPGASAEAALNGLSYAMDWRNRKPDAVSFATGLADARQYIIDSRHQITSLLARVAELEKQVTDTERHSLRLRQEAADANTTLMQMRISEDAWLLERGELQDQLAAAKGAVRALKHTEAYVEIRVQATRVRGWASQAEGHLDDIRQALAACAAAGLKERSKDE